jgi:integrase
MRAWSATDSPQLCVGYADVRCSYLPLFALVRPHASQNTARVACWPLTRIVQAITIASMASKQLELWSRPAGTVQPRGAREAAASTTASKPVDTVAALPCTAERVRFYVDQSRAHRTRTAYDQGFRAFERWCTANGLSALPATSESIVLYLTTLLESGRKLSTVKRARVAIGQAHAAARLPRSDRAHQVRELERGMGRVHGTREEGAPPLLHEQVVQITKAIRAGARGDRDRVLLLLGFWGAFRASELVALRIEDVTLEPARLRVLVRRSKEDQLGRGEIVRLDASPQRELCVVDAVIRWLQRVGESSGPLLRQVHGRNVLPNAMQPRAVSRAVRKLAVDADLGPQYSAHSLRAGLATSAYARGVSERDIQEHGRWKDRRSLDRYIHPVAFASRPSIVAAFG